MRSKEQSPQGRLHLHFVLKIYAMQLAGGRHFLHEHPQGASSWQDSEVLKLLRHPRVGVVTSHQCQFGLVTRDAQGQLKAAKKPTKFASSSVQMLRRLAVKCPGGHAHEHLVGGKAKAAAFYPPQLVEAILRGIRDTADAQDQQQFPEMPEEFICAMTRAGRVQDVPPGVEAKVDAQSKADQVQHYRVPFKYASGKVVELDLQWKDTYRDEYTNDILPTHHIRSAMAEEMEYLCREVLEGVSLQEALDDPDRVLIGGRWVTSNKQDAAHPDCRGRYVGQETNHVVKQILRFTQRHPHSRPSKCYSVCGRKTGPLPVEAL